MCLQRVVTISSARNEFFNKKLYLFLFFKMIHLSILQMKRNVVPKFVFKTSFKPSGSILHRLKQKCFQQILSFTILTLLFSDISSQTFLRNKGCLFLFLFVV